ncbi:hypothetical protein P9112_006621 [Eukaryota sp. TZLM1-RC]
MPRYNSGRFHPKCMVFFRAIGYQTHFSQEERFLLFFCFVVFYNTNLSFVLSDFVCTNNILFCHSQQSTFLIQIRIVSNIVTLLFIINFIGLFLSFIVPRKYMSQMMFSILLQCLRIISSVHVQFKYCALKLRYHC